MKNFLTLILMVAGFNATAQYCTPTYSNAPVGGCNDGDRIYRFILGDIDLISGCSPGGYQLYASAGTDLIPGESYTASIEVSYSPQNRVLMFIDWNEDFDFDDPNETYGSAASLPAYGIETINFTVPTSINLGPKRIRVVTRYVGVPTSCEGAGVYGETEDYNAIVVPPPPGAALDFDLGNFGVVSNPHISTTLDGATEMTVEAWVNPTQTPTQLNGLFGSDQFFLGQNTGGGYFFSIYGVNTTNMVNSLALPLNVWHHIACSWDGTSIKMYVDGELQDEQPLTDIITTSVGQQIIFGSNLDAVLDEVRIWNVSRTKCDINTYYNVEIPNTSSGLLANYHFNQGTSGAINSSDTVIDFSGNNNTIYTSGFAFQGATSNWVATSGVTSGDTTISNIPPAFTSTLANSAIYCIGDSVLLSVEGTNYDNLTWNNGVQDSVFFSPVNGTTYSVTLENNATSCVAQDSIVLNEAPAAVATDLGNGSFSSNLADSYQWINCTTNTTIANETSQVFTPTSNGNYAVITTNGSGCIDTSACVSISDLGIEEGTTFNFSFAPNPSSTDIQFVFLGSSQLVTITDMNGKTLIITEIQSNESVDISKLEKGMYLVQINKHTERLIKM